MLVRLSEKHPDPHYVRIITGLLQSDGVIIIPTDSVYAIACSMYSKKAIERIALMKSIKPEKANFSILCSDLRNLSEFTQNVDKSVFRMLKKNLPGPFTFILSANNRVPKVFDNKKKTIGIRVPDSNIAKTIVEAFGNPLVVTSLHDEEDEVLDYLTDPELIFDRYEKLVDLVIDGGYGDNIPSTIVDLTEEEPVIIRQGKGELVF